MRSRISKTRNFKTTCNLKAWNNVIFIYAATKTAHFVMTFTKQVHEAQSHVMPSTAVRISIRISLPLILNRNRFSCAKPSDRLNSDGVYCEVLSTAVITTTFEASFWFYEKTFFLVLFQSTGGSTGEEDEELLSMSAETRRNTVLNEASQASEGSPVSQVAAWAVSSCVSCAA